jgi:hypothetical protein
MILSKSLTTAQIADAAECSARSVTTIRSNLRQFGDTRAPSIRAGRPRSITPLMLEALCDHLLEKPGLYLDEMALFLWDEESADLQEMVKEDFATEGEGTECRFTRLLPTQSVRVPVVPSSVYRRVRV